MTETQSAPSARRVALVTGGSRGIGRAIAQALARDGLFVVINYQNNRAAAEETLASLGGPQNGRLLPFDVADEAAVDAAIKSIAEQEGRLDVLVNNAAVAVDGLLLRTKTADFMRVINTNLSSVFFLCRAASRLLLKAKESGRIINLTSVVGETGNAGQVSYTSAKAGLLGLSRTLARELASRGITVNAVSPGYIDTDMTRSTLTEEMRKQLTAQIPLGRTGKPEDVAEAVAFLASPKAGYITGQVLRVNGGLLIG
ncbi:MAG: 3-oxoacyl-ACP reductase FabG [Myxococcales bacterium]|nr:3-oxoacyl-ACP reductase FabG [Myxococcales bacterium]